MMNSFYSRLFRVSSFSFSFSQSSVVLFTKSSATVTVSHFAQHFCISKAMSSATKTAGVRAYEVLEIPSGGLPPDVTVDLRSDTLTKPNKAMRQAMAEAEVGDDVFKEDPTVKEFERRMAEVTGKEAALFITSGTMGNLIAALVHCYERGSEMIVGDQSHMFQYEQGGASQFGGIHSQQIPNNPDGTFDVEGLLERIRSDDIHYPKTKLIAVENTHNRCGGRVMPMKWLDEVAKVGKDYGISLHMDGARVFNAAIALGQPVSRIVRDFDSVSICFSKGLASPVGSVLVGSKVFIEKALRMRKALGGGMRQSGILAAAALYSLDNLVSRLKDDHDNAKIIAKIINGMNNPNVFINIENVESNILMLNVLNTDIVKFCQRLAIVDETEKQLVSVVSGPWSATKIRLVTHADVSQEMAKMAAEKICLVSQAAVSTFNDDSLITTLQSLLRKANNGNFV